MRVYCCSFRRVTLLNLKNQLPEGGWCIFVCKISRNLHYNQFFSLSIWQVRNYFIVVKPILYSCCCLEERCEAMTIPLCRSNDVPFKYNMTRIPNFFKHFSQSEAAQQVSQFLPLVKVDCSPDLSLFLCSLYSPPCIGPQKPCRELCNRVKTGCASVLEEFGVPWPEVLACEKFPLSSGDELCFQPTKVSATTTQTPATTTQILTLTGECFFLLYSLNSNFEVLFCLDNHDDDDDDNPINWISPNCWQKILNWTALIRRKDLL